MCVLLTITITTTTTMPATSYCPHPPLPHLPESHLAPTQRPPPPHPPHRPQTKPRQDVRIASKCCPIHWLCQPLPEDDDYRPPRTADYPDGGSDCATRIGCFGLLGAWGVPQELNPLWDCGILAGQAEGRGGGGRPGVGAGQQERLRQQLESWVEAEGAAAAERVVRRLVGPGRAAAGAAAARAQAAVMRAWKDDCVIDASRARATTLYDRGGFSETGSQRSGSVSGGRGGGGGGISGGCSSEAEGGPVLISAGPMRHPHAGDDGSPNRPTTPRPIIYQSRLEARAEARLAHAVRLLYPEAARAIDRGGGAAASDDGADDRDTYGFLGSLAPTAALWVHQGEGEESIWDASLVVEARAGAQLIVAGEWVRTVLASGEGRGGNSMDAARGTQRLVETGFSQALGRSVEAVRKLEHDGMGGYDDWSR